jgi:3-hydroxybutyryl-CoA dehydrogenase
MGMITTICVCGAGTMGSGIAQVAAQSGFTTIQYDLNADMLNKSRIAINKNLQSQVDKGRMDEASKIELLDSITFTNNISDCIADVIIEAVVEALDTKVNLFNQLATLNNSDTIFATNTSSLPIGLIAAKIISPERVVGMHFFNPAYLMKLVEIVRGEHTSDEVINTVSELAKQMCKTPVLCNDSPGFIVNRIARPFYLEAMQLVEKGLADAKTIDEIMEATGFKMGPFKLVDLIGMDINFSVSNIVYEAMGKPGRLKPSSLQRKKVDAGELGRKTGKGFYQY